MEFPSPSIDPTLVGLVCCSPPCSLRFEPWRGHHCPVFPTIHSPVRVSVTSVIVLVVGCLWCIVIYGLMVLLVLVVFVFFVLAVLAVCSDTVLPFCPFLGCAVSVKRD